MALPAATMATSLQRLPPRLRPGDTVGLVAPASSDDNPDHLHQAVATVRGMGLVPKIGNHVSDIYGYFSGTDQDRAADINAMFEDDSVRALFAVRGGWGSARLLPLLDWPLIRTHPKLLIGFSDVTALHLAFAARAGFSTLHAPNIGNRWEKVSWDSFWRMAFAAETPWLDLSDGQEEGAIGTLHAGKAQGRLLGGNLTVLSTLMGTPWLPEFDQAILFLEDVGEAEYRIDRMLNQLALAGILTRIGGLVFGQCTRCSSDTPDYAGFRLNDLVDQYCAPLKIPAFSGANFGHIRNQLSLPFGAMVELDANKGRIRPLKPIVG